MGEKQMPGGLYQTKKITEKCSYRSKFKKCCSIYWSEYTNISKIVYQ